MHTFLFALLSVASAFAAPLTYPILWNDVPTSPAAGKNLTANCICNLHAFVCDLDCCCDPDCPQAVSDASRQAGECRPEGPPEQTLDFCVPNGFVAKVNLPTSFDFFELKKQAADDNFFGQLLCITKSSNPKLSDEYPDPPAGDVDGNPSKVTCPKTPSTPSPPSSYQIQTPLYIARNGVRQRLTLPAPLFSSTCVDQAEVGFLNNIPSNPADVFRSCIRAIPDASTLEQMCAAGGVLSPELYQDFQFADTPIGTANMDPFLPPALIINGNTTSTDAANVTSTFANGVCSNAVQYINVTVFYSVADASSVEATITKITVALILRDVAASSGALRQFVLVSFVDSALQTEILESFSGNPGYIKGLPLLGGVLAEDPNSSKTAVRRFVRGITAPQGRESDGVCSPEAAGASIRFGANSTTSCAVELNKAELENFCTSQPPQHYLENALGEVYTALASQEARIGIWGNSDPNNVNQWLQVKVSNFPFNDLSFTSSPASCSNVVVGYDLQVLTGVAFSSNNLQRKVLYAHLCFRTATWTFPATQNETQPLRFYLKSTSTHVPKHQEPSTGIKKPAPPLRTYVPKDIFYPFVTSGAQRRHGGPCSLLASVFGALSLRLMLL